MSAAVASLHSHGWSSSTAGAPAAGAWQLGDAQSTEDGVKLRWHLPRLSVFRPLWIFGGYVLLCLASVAVAMICARVGFAPLLIHAGVEAVLVGLTLVWVARHSRDRDTLTLHAGVLRVDQRYGSRERMTLFRSPWVRVEPLRGEGSLIEISGEGRQVVVGRHVQPALRSVLARELRRALRDGEGLQHPRAIPVEK